MVSRWDIKVPRDNIASGDPIAELFGRSLMEHVMSVK